MPCLEGKETQSSALQKWSKIQNQNILTPNSFASLHKTWVTSIGPNSLEY